MPETGDAGEVTAESRRRRVDNAASAEVVVPWIGWRAAVIEGSRRRCWRRGLCGCGHDHRLLGRWRCRDGGGWGRRCCRLWRRCRRGGRCGCLGGGLTGVAVAGALARRTRNPRADANHEKTTDDQGESMAASGQAELRQAPKKYDYAQAKNDPAN